MLLQYLRGCQQEFLEKLARSKSQLWSPIVIKAVFQMRNEVFEGVKQLFLIYYLLINQVYHIYYSSFSYLYLGFTHLPLDRHNQHPLQDLLAQRGQIFMQLWQIDNVLDEHKRIHSNLKIALRIEHELEDLNDFLQKSTDLRAAVPHYCIELETIFACPIPTSILLSLYHLLQDRADLRCIEVSHTPKTALPSQQYQCLSCLSPLPLRDTSGGFHVDEYLKYNMEEVLVDLFQSFEKGVTNLKQGSKSLVIFIEQGLIATESGRQWGNEIINSFTPEKHMTQDVQQNNSIFG